MASSSTSVGTFTTDASLIIRSWDEQLARFSGIPADEAIGRPLAAVVPSVETRGLLKHFEDVVTSGTVRVLSPSLHHYLVPCRVQAPSQHFDHMQQRATLGPIRTRERISGVVVAIEDVTSRIEMEREIAATLARNDADWQGRRSAMHQMAQLATPDFAAALVQVIRTHHHDFDVLSSSLQLLAESGADVAETLAELLREPDADLRVQAALALGSQVSLVAQDALIAALDDENSNVRFHAIESLGRLRASGAIERLTAIAAAEDAFLAFAAIDALGAIGDPRVAPKLMPLIHRGELRLAVISALEHIGDETAVLPLVETLNAYSDATIAAVGALSAIYERLERVYKLGVSVAQVVATALDERGRRHVLAAVAAAPGPALARVLAWIDAPEAQAALVQMLVVPSAQPVVLEVLPKLGDAVAPLLAEQFQRAPNDDVRHAVITALGHHGRPSATPVLLQAMDEVPHMLTTIAGALARIVDPRSFDALVGLLGHEDAAVRQAAVSALSSMGHAELPARILPLLDSSHVKQRESAIRIAGYFGYPEARARVIDLAIRGEESVRCAALEQLPLFAGDDAVAALVLASQADSPTVRASAARALGQMEHPRARDLLMTLSDDPAVWVRYFATRALAHHPGAEGIAILRRVAADDSATPVRIAAVEGLAQIDPNAGRSLFASLMASASSELAAAAVAALGRLRSPDARAQLVTAASDSRRSVRRAAVEALEQHTSEEAVVALHRAATDQDPDVRRAAVRALGGIVAHGGDWASHAAQVLVAMLASGEHFDEVAATLVALPADAVGALLRYGPHPDTATRRALIDVLGRSPHPHVTQLVRDALADPDDTVRQIAQVALGRRHHVL